LHGCVVDDFCGFVECGFEVEFYLVGFEVEWFGGDVVVVYWCGNVD